MLYLRLLVACGAMLLSLLCFDGALSGTETTTAAEETASVGYTDTEVLFADVQEAVGEGMLTVQMGARSFDARVLDDSDFAVDTLAGEAPTSSVGCSAQAEFGPACDAAEDADEVEEAPYEIIRAEARRREEERLKQIAAEKEAEKRRIAAEKVQCDLYDYLSGRDEYAQLFKGSYLTNYSWGETTLAELTGEHLYGTGE